eukprot:9496218-Pyramimonas_sp.AAC.1
MPCAMCSTVKLPAIGRLFGPSYPFPNRSCNPRTAVVSRSVNADPSSSTYFLTLLPNLAVMPKKRKWTLRMPGMKSQSDRIWCSTRRHMPASHIPMLMDGRFSTSSGRPVARRR